MHVKYENWLELHASWNIDIKIAVRGRNHEAVEMLTKRFWNEQDALFCCPRSIADGDVYILPLKALDFLSSDNDRSWFEISRVASGSIQK